MTGWKVPPLIGVPDARKPLVDLSGDHTFWDLLGRVNQSLKHAGLFDKAEEFRALAVSECDGDNGMLLTLALCYVRVPGQEMIDP